MSEIKNAIIEEILKKNGVEIEQGVPIKEVYPFSKMMVGDSFFVPLSGKSHTSIRSKLAKSWRDWKQESEKLNYVFVSKKATKDGQEGRRVWRIK